MSDTWVQLIASTIPQFLFAIVLFWLCQRNSDKQRDAYQEQIKDLYELLRGMLSAINKTVSVLEKHSGNVNQG